MTPTLTAEQIGELEALLAKATGGKWIQDPVNKEMVCTNTSPYEYICDCGADSYESALSFLQEADNSAVIVALRNAAPALIAMAKHSIKMDEAACADQGVLTNAIGRAEAIEAELTDLREEVAFWRGEVVARLCFAIELHDYAVTNNDEPQADEIRINTIGPVLASLREANDKEWHPRCDFCGEFIRPEDERQPLPGEDFGHVHRRCGNPDEPGLPKGLEWQEEVIAAARAIVRIKP